MVATDDQIMLKDPQGSNIFVRYDEPVSTFDARYGLPTYGEIYVRGIDVGIALAAQDTWYQVAIWSPGTSFGPDGVNGENNGLTPDVTNDHITISASGIYSVEYHLSAYSAAQNEFRTQIFTNNGANPFYNTRGYITTVTANAVQSFSGGGFCDFNINDTVELWVERKDGGGSSKTLTFRQGTLSIHRLE